ncbi:MAG: gamma-glutamylcyclotransferase [Magnetovibrionaceae bacterium]
MSQALGMNRELNRPWTKAAIRKPRPFWVFGYGSLMWRPGFDPAEKIAAKVRGYHRALCVHSLHHRGTPEQPGLVVGLDRGGWCLGQAYRVLPINLPKVTAYLDERERITGIYEPVVVKAELIDGRRVSCYTFRVRRRHQQYFRRATLETALPLVQSGKGASGTCLDYLENTVGHLRACGVHDARLSRLVRDAKAR